MADGYAADKHKDKRDDERASLVPECGFKQPGDNGDERHAQA